MRKALILTLALLAISVIANIYLVISSHRPPIVTSAESTAYYEFVQGVNESLKELNAASTATQDSAKTEAVVQADRSTLKAMGILQGMQSEAEKQGINFNPTVTLLMYSDIPGPSDSRYEQFLNKSIFRLKFIESHVENTSLQQGTRGVDVQKAINKMNEAINTPDNADLLSALG